MNGRIYEHTSGFVGADGNGNYVSLVGVGEIIGQTITALGSVKDANLRRKYEQQIGELSRMEQEKLNKELLKAQNDSDRRKIFADVLSQLNKSRIEALNKPKNNVIWYVLGGIAILTASYFIYKKLKK
jgi:hypothetical protein